MALINKCCCFNLKTGTFVSALWVTISGFFALLWVILDQAASDSDQFEIGGSFVTDWRILIWKQWLACNIVMIFIHLVMVGLSIAVCVAHKKWIIYQQIPLLKAWYWMMAIYIIVECGIAFYQFSWYGKNIFRVLSMPWLTFIFFYWLLRTVINFFCFICVISRVQDIKWDLEHGDKKDISSFAADTSYAYPGYGYEGYDYGADYGQYGYGDGYDQQAYPGYEGQGYPGYGDAGGYYDGQYGGQYSGQQQKPGFDQYGYPIDDGLQHGHGDSSV